MPQVQFGFSPNRYPKACDHPATPPTGSGEIAAYSKPTTTIANIDGTVVARFDSGASLKWSASGKWLLSSAGHLWTATGEDRGPMFPAGSMKAAWSPSSDCAFAMSADEKTLFVARPGHDAVEFAEGDLSDFGVSPDGKHLVVTAFAGGDTSHALVELIGLEDHSLSSYDPGQGACCVVLASAWLDGDSPLMWVSPGTSVAADGWTLQAFEANAHGNARLTDVADEVIPAANGYVARCGDRLVAVVGGGRPYPALSHKRLAVVSPGASQAYLTPHGQAFQWPSCSSDGNYIAAIGVADGGTVNDGHLVIVAATGGVAQTLTSGNDLADFDPGWGPLGTGVLFGRASDSGKPWTLWYAPEGSSPKSTNIRTSPYAYDWSVTPPTGLP
ncbi:MAG: hypothetical protein ABR579_10935 [Actinomycetota bacterium]